MMERTVFEYLLNSVWQVPMLAAMAWLLIRLSRPGARVQHTVWLGTLALAVLLPLRGIDVSVRSRPHATYPATIQFMGITQASGNPLEAASQPDAAGTIAIPTTQRASWMQAVPWLATRRIRLSASVADWLLALYFLVVVFRLFQLGWAWRAARRLVAQSRPATFSESESILLQRLCDDLGVAEPEILMSEEIVSPLTVGGMRPVLVLPDSLHGISAMEMTAMLCHELVHVRRRDYWMNLVCQAGALPIAYHPATYAVQRRVRQTREMACDELTADTMQSASGYARCLLALAERMLHGRAFADQVQAVGLFDNNKLEERIMRLLETKTRMSVRAKIVRTAAGTILMTAGIAAATVLHVTPSVVHAAIRPIPAMQAVIPQAAATGTATAPQGVSQPPADSTQAAPSQADPAQASPAPAAEPTPASAPQEDAAPNPEPAPQGNPQPVPPVDVQPVPPSAPRTAPMPPTPPDVAPVPPAPPDASPNASPNEIRSRVERREERRRERRTEERNNLTPEERTQLESQLAAVREQMKSEMKVMHSPEFKQQMDAVRQQFRSAMQKQRDAERQRWTELKESPEFKQQMAEARQQMDAAREKIRTAARQQRAANGTDSATFKQQMAEAQEQMATAVQKLQSAEMQRQMKLKDNPEFEQQMEAARKQFQDAMQKLQSDAMQRQLQVLQSPEFKEQIQKMEELRQKLHGDRSGDAVQHP